MRGRAERHRRLIGESTDARGVPQGVLRGRAGGAGAPAVGRRAGVRAGGKAQPIARRESTSPQHVGARGVPQGGGLAARLRLRKDEEEDAMPTALIWQKWKCSSQIAYGLFLVHLKFFFSPGYLSGI